MVEATPNTPSSTSSTTTAPSQEVRIATRDLILFNDETTPIEVMTDLIFENIGGQEMINIARNDIINGQEVIYQPIKNITGIYFKYNPQNILSLQNTSNEYFKSFPIKLEEKIPNVGLGPNGRTVYLDETTGDIIINLINLSEDEQVEIQILNNGAILNDTIY